MSASSFIEWHIAQIRRGGCAVLFRKIKRVLCIPHELLLFILAVPVVLVIHLIRPWLLVRWSEWPSPRIGHFAANTEPYLCERDAGINVPMQRPHLSVNATSISVHLANHVSEPRVKHNARRRDSPALRVKNCFRHVEYSTAPLN